MSGITSREDIIQAIIDEITTADYSTLYMTLLFLTGDSKTKEG